MSKLQNLEKHISQHLKNKVREFEINYINFSSKLKRSRINIIYLCIYKNIMLEKMLIIF